MAFQKGEGGRAKGSPNKTGREIKEIYEQILKGNTFRIEESLLAVYNTNPGKFLDIMMKLSEFAVPKLRSVDTTFDVAEDSALTGIKIEVITKEKNE